MDSILSSQTFAQSKYDCLKYGTLFVVARLLLAPQQSPLHDANLSHPILDPNNASYSVHAWAKAALLVLIGFVAYWVIIRNLINESDYVSGDLRLALRDLLYFGTMLVVSRLLSGHALDKEWAFSALYIILGFISYDIVVRKFVRVSGVSNNVGLVIDDTLRYTTMYALAAWLSDRHFNAIFFKELGAVLVGLGVFNYFVNPLL